MASFQTIRPGGSQPEDDMVTRVGAAAGLVAKIQENYSQQAQAESEPDAREALANQARADAERVLGEQGLSVQDYNAVLSAAENDPQLEERLLTAAREVL